MRKGHCRGAPHTISLVHNSPYAVFRIKKIDDIELKDQKTRNEERHWRSAAATAAAGI